MYHNVTDLLPWLTMNSVQQQDNKSPSRDVQQKSSFGCHIFSVYQVDFGNNMETQRTSCGLSVLTLPAARLGQQGAPASRLRLAVL